MKCVNILHLSFRAKQFNSENTFSYDAKVKLVCISHLCLCLFPSPSPSLWMYLCMSCVWLLMLFMQNYKISSSKSEQQGQKWEWKYEKKTGLDGTRCTEKTRWNGEEKKRGSTTISELCFCFCFICYLICMQKWMKRTSVLSCEQRVTEKAKKQRWQRQC